MSVTGTTAANSNVPAWKRLGLKLKRDEDASANSPGKAVGAADSSDIITPKRSLDSESNVKRGKRRKTHSDDTSGFVDSTLNTSITPKKPNSHGDNVARGQTREVPSPVARTPKHIVFDAEEPTEQNHHKSEASRARSPGSRRKSVTFTPDTKRGDGFSASNLFKVWSAQQTTEPIIDPSLDATDPTSSTPSKKDNKKQKSKDSANPKNPPAAAKSLPLTSHETPAYVSYLTQFHNDRANWKFNKNKQTDLLKNLFSLDHLPAALTPAIAAYISGLGGASARRRVHEEATEILSAIASDPENGLTGEGGGGGEGADMSTPEGRRAAYAAALRRQIERYDASGAGRSAWADEQLDEMRQKHERGLRAEAVLRELLLDELHPERKGEGAARVAGAAAVARGSGGVAAAAAAAAAGEGKSVEETVKAKKKRKSRVEVSDSSSSDDSTDSSDESDESDEEPGGKSGKGKAKSKPIFDKKLLDKKFGKKH